MKKSGNVDIKRFHSRDKQLCKSVGTKESVYIRKEFKSHRIGLVHHLDPVLLFWYTDMAAVTSCETLYSPAFAFHDHVTENTGLNGNSLNRCKHKTYKVYSNTFSFLGFLALSPH